jgi:thioredoxin reductase (NADPH)
MKHVDVIIIGGGPAGISAAIWCKRLGINHLLLEEKGHLGGQLLDIKNKIIDYPGIIAENGKEMQEIFIKHFYELGCSYKLNAAVLSINSSTKTVEVHCENNIEEILFEYVILAMGAEQACLQVPGEKEMIKRGERYSATSDAHLFKNKPVVFVGGGDRAFEGAIILANAGAHVYLLNRSKNFRARDEYVHAVYKMDNIKIITDTRVTAIHGERQVTSVDLIDNKGSTSTINADAVFVRIGARPNTKLIRNIVDINEKGLIVTDHFGMTSENFIYAIGDICLNPLFSSISSSIGQGMIVSKRLSLLIKA